MKIKRLSLINFRRFADFGIEFDKQLTVLVARNGAGKSSVLDAVATALGPFLTRLPKVSGINPKDTDFRTYDDGKKPPYMRITCESFKGMKWDRTEKRDQAKSTASLIPEGIGVKAINEYVDQFIDAYNDDEEFELPIFIHYGTGRGVFEVPQRKKNFGKDFLRFDAYTGSLESHTNFRKFVEYFYFLEEQENKKIKELRSFDFVLPELKAIRKAINQLMPEFSNPRGVYPAGILVDWKTNNSIKQLRIEQLSDGYRTTLAMVMDIAARMAEANPDKEDPLKTEGVVLIDEVDLHLHPGWQQTIIPDLMRTFPNIQFIITTHSPQVVSTVPARSLRVIDWEGEGDEESVRLIPVDFSLGAESQLILEQILGVSPRPKNIEIVALLEQYKQLVSDDKWDSKEALTIRKRLDEWGAEHEPELLRLDMDIRLKEYDRQS
ncbi:AAA family ATPase [Neptunomonas sp.]|uniref:AAA family ATPase n=1 Tax=Neptunomonas sp. TaxID=1971898 RepID=UPI0035614DB8